MYIKKILIAIAVIGLLVAAFFANFVYKAMLSQIRLLIMKRLMFIYLVMQLIARLEVS